MWEGGRGRQQNQGGAAERRRDQGGVADGGGGWSQQVVQQRVGGVEEAVGDRRAGHLQPHRHLQHERHHAGLRRPPRRPRARRRLLRKHRHRRLQLRPHGTVHLGDLLSFSCLIDMLTTRLAFCVLWEPHML